MDRGAAKRPGHRPPDNDWKRIVLQTQHMCRSDLRKVTYIHTLSATLPADSRRARSIHRGNYRDNTSSDLLIPGVIAPNLESKPDCFSASRTQVEPSTDLICDHPSREHTAYQPPSRPGKCRCQASLYCPPQSLSGVQTGAPASPSIHRCGASFITLRPPCLPYCVTLQFIIVMMMIRVLV